MRLLETKAMESAMTILAATKRQAHPLLETPFGRAFLRYDGQNMDRDFAASYAAFAMGSAGFRHYLVKSVWGNATGVKPGAFSMDSTEANYQALFEEQGASTLHHTRIRRKGNSIVVSIPVGRFDFGTYYMPDVRWATTATMPKTEGNLNAAVNRIQSSKFRNLLVLDSALDLTVSADEVMRATPVADYETRTSGRGENGYPALFARVFSKFRFMRCSLREASTSDQRRLGIGAASGTRIPYDDLSMENPLVQANPDLGWEVLKYMLSIPVVGFVEAELGDDFIEPLSGMSAAEVPLSLIGNWLSGTIEYQWFGSEDSLQDVFEVSSIGRSRAESEASTVLPYDPAANEDRLCIDNVGYFYYLPAADLVEQYEAEVETVFADERGEWTPMDVKNPKNVIRFDDGAGRTRTQPRKVQPDRLIYTDFKAGVIAYTDHQGLMKVTDISSFRAVNATHIKELLNLSLWKPSYDNEEFVDMLNAALRSALNANPAIAQELPYSATETFGLNEYQRDLANAQFREFVSGNRGGDLAEEAARWRLRFMGIAGIDENLRDEVEDLSFRHISPTSPVPELRIVYRLLAEYTQRMAANFEVAASEYRLLPTLQRLGFLTTLVKNAPRYDEVFEQDRVDRAPYTDPVEDYRNVEIPEIPFTRGVTLMPHQVKVFAALKRFPKRFTLDIAAGGGKTFTAVLVALMYMKHVGVRHPLVICPNILLKNYFEDATYATSGAVNIIAVNSEIIARWGADKLAELIRKAPINTVVVASFDSMAKGTTRIYGTRKISVNSVTEFLKQFDFDFVVVDESHRIKRMSSNTNRNVTRVAARAKYSGIMTGTLLYNGAADVVGQFNVMDPTIFGSDSHFDNKFMEATAGVKRAKSGAPAVVQRRIADSTTYVKIARKEWASLLPPRVDEFDGTATEKFWILNDPEYPGEPMLTPAQSDYYNNVLLKEVRDKIFQDSQTDEGLRRLLRAMEGRGNAETEEDDEKLLEDIMEKLNPYLARLEIFVANPVNSREASFTSRLADPNDRMSPKAKKVAQLCRQHIERGYIGKILVFTQYNESAEGIFNSLPKDLRDRAVHYSADNKMTLTQFTDDPNKLILVGNERSIGTGLNLQVASRIIRCESTWNWGALEQAESRVNRPVPKSKETRKAIYMDWLLVNGTIDVTKTCRMISKAVESYKFNNAGNPAFDDMDPLEPVKLSLENILLRNDVSDPSHNVKDHLLALQLCRVLEEQDFQAFRVDPNNRTEGYELRGGVLPGSGLLKNVPYVPGMALYGTKDLGLVPFVEYVTNVRKSTLVAFDPVGHVIHTEEGDGRCVSSRRSGGELRSVTVELPSGERGTFDLTSVFIVTRPNVDVDTRRQIAETVMSEHLGRPVAIAPQAPLTVEDNPAAAGPNKGSIKLLRSKPVPAVPSRPDSEYALYVMSVGHMIALTATPEDQDTPIDMLLEHDFITVKPYYYAQVKNPTALEEWYTKARKVTGFANDSRAQIEEMLALMKAHNPSKFYQNVKPAVLRDFWRSQRQAPKAGLFSGFVSIEDNGVGKHPKIYLVAFKHQNPQFRNVASKSKVPGLVWEATESEQAWYLAPTVKAAAAKLREVNEVAPVKNFKLLLAKLSQVRPTPAK